MGRGTLMAHGQSRGTPGNLETSQHSEEKLGLVGEFKTLAARILGLGVRSSS